MFRPHVLLLATGFCVLGGLAVCAQDNTELKAILKKSIDAHGGEKQLAKFKAVNTKFKGTMEIMNNKVDVVGDTLLQRPDKVRNLLKLDFNGKQIDILTVFTGKKLWVNAAGQTREIDDPKILDAARDEMKAEVGGHMMDYLKPPYELNAIGQVKVRGKDTIGIRISKKGQKDFSMFFDKKTFLLAKTEMRTLDAGTGQEVTQEKFVLEYQDKDGMKIAKRVEIQKDGKTFMDIEITEIRALESIDEAMFMRP